MIEENPAGGGELNTARAALHQRHSQLDLEVTHLPAQGWLGGVQTLLGGNREAALFGDGNEVAKVAQFHERYLSGMAQSCKVFSFDCPSPILPTTVAIGGLQPGCSSTCGSGDIATRHEPHQISTSKFIGDLS